MYEGMESDRRLLPLLPAMARIDGRAFHTLTRNTKRPYDENFSKLMMQTTKLLVEETNACIGYTQSDEISLCWYSDNIKSEIFFGGRIQKMVSQLAALTTAFFNDLLLKAPLEYRCQLPTFDSRVWNVPTLVEGANVFLWREMDATRNSISMAAQSMFSCKELHLKDTSEMQEMMFQQGTNWNDYPAFFKRGTYFQKRKILKKFSVEELEKLPPKHAARSNPELMIERSEVRRVEMPPFGTVANRVDVIFFGAEPVTKEEVLQ